MQLGAVLGAAVLVALTADDYHWSVWPLVVITAFTIVSDLTSRRYGIVES